MTAVLDTDRYTDKLEFGGESPLTMRAAGRPANALRTLAVVGTPLDKNYGMIATGNHLDFDSLRGAPLLGIALFSDKLCFI